jgi:hypothetical protein
MACAIVRISNDSWHQPSRTSNCRGTEDTERRQSIRAVRRKHEGTKTPRNHEARTTIHPAKAQRRKEGKDRYGAWIRFFAAERQAIC